MPVLPSVFHVDAFALECVMRAHEAAAAFMRERDGIARAVAVNEREAAIAFRSEAYLRVDGAFPGEAWAPLSGDFRTGDGRWIRLHCNFAHHALAALAALGLPPDADRNALTAAVARCDAFAIEEAVIAHGGAAAAMRSLEEWTAHPQARALADLPLVAIERIGDASPAARHCAAERPLDGVRVLDLTRVIAGPVAGRVLAAYGADVLRIGAAHLPTILPAVIDTGFGKRFAELDLRTDAGRASLRALIARADIVLQAYRPHALARYGFGADEIAAIKPGIVCVSISAYGHAGPWRERRGFDSVVQMANGIAHEGMRRSGGDRPRPLPAQAQDHGTGWLAAAAAVETLLLQAHGGGSWHVQLSLARTGEHLKAMGEADTLRLPMPALDDVRDLLDETASPFGRVTHLRVPGRIEGVDLCPRTPPHPQGYDAAAFSTDSSSPGKRFSKHV